MRYRFKTLTRQESAALIDEIEAGFDRHGFGEWAVERTADHRVIGFVGLEIADATAPFDPPIHIGWHLAHDAWGYGYASEAAEAVLDFSFDEVGLAQVVAHTSSLNARSRAVMDRLGMTHNPEDDFDAPWYPPGHPKRRFVLYRMTAANWNYRKASA